jgi:hypothetical protein
MRSQCRKVQIQPKPQDFNEILQGTALYRSELQSQIVDLGL